MLSRVFWKGKKVFLTGHTGFKGAWLSMWLFELGAQVKGYALDPPTTPSLFKSSGIEKKIDSVIADICDLQRLKDEINDFNPEIVIHMAAQPLVRESYKNPVETYQVNVMGTVNILEAVRNCSTVRVVVNVTTDKVYDNQEWPWAYRENERLGGYDPYSNSKACSELITSAYRSSFFPLNDYKNHRVAIATARAGNVIGGGDWAKDRLIPDCINALTDGKTINIRYPYSIRPWQHVLEPLRGYLLLAENLYNDGSNYADAWNFGPLASDEKPVEWIVRTLCDKWGESSGYVVDKSEHFHEAGYLRLDHSKAISELGWSPIWNLEITLEKIIYWWKHYTNGESTYELCINQLREYMKSIEVPNE